MSYVIPLYARFPLCAVRGEGIHMINDQGERYIDGCSGYAVSALGHGHPILKAALHAQVDALWHCSNALVIPQQEILAERLCKISFGKKAFFCNSGTEAFDASVKIARKYHSDKGAPHRNRAVVMRNCFHGRTMAAISAANRSYMVDGFAPLLDGFDMAEPNDIESLKKSIGPNTGFVVIEPVMGEGGVLALSKEYMQELRRICDAKDILLVVDEVQCGMGRSGKFFAYEWSGIEPDIMMVAKGLGCGFPVGAYVVGEKCANTLTQGVHGTTFGGNPLAMAVGNAVLDVMTEQDFFTHVNDIGARLEEGLLALTQKFPQVFVEGVRGKGLMLAVQCQETVKNLDYAQACFEEKLLLIGAMQNTMRVMPPLISRAEDIDTILSCMAKAAEKYC